MLDDKIKGWLQSQGKTAQPNDYRAELFTEDNVERITIWNEGALGPQPTQEQLDAAPVFTPVPASISDRQFAQALAMLGLITSDQALAWVKVGTVPALIQAVVDAIADEGVRFSANMLLGGATVFERNHPMVGELAGGLSMTSAQIDDIWRLGDTL